MKLSFSGLQSIANGVSLAIIAIATAAPTGAIASVEVVALHRSLISQQLAPQQNQPLPPKPYPPGGSR